MPSYGLVAIVKDEAPRIGRLLESARPLVSAWTIVDTGSTDGTQEIVRAEIARRAVGTGAADAFRLLETPFVDFGTTRSVAFAAARGTVDWLLALDADMTVEIDEGWTPDPAVDAYMLRMGSADFEYRLPLLLRGDLPWVSRGAAHEYTLLADGTLGRREPTDAVRITSGGVALASAEKSRWHASLLEAELAREPENPRATFYLAQTYRDLGDPRALGLYLTRAAIGGWDEEVFWARYQAALLEPAWPDRLAGLLATWESRPTRLEPLYHALALLNEHDQHRVAYALAQVVDPSRFTSDVLFVEPWVWRWGITFQRSIAAWWVKRSEFGDLTERLRALELPPAVRERVEANAAA